MMGIGLCLGLDSLDDAPSGPSLPALGNLTALYDASTLSPGKITSYSDSSASQGGSGSGGTLVQGTTARQPTAIASGINGKPDLTFAAGNILAGGTNSLGTSAISLGVTFKSAQTGNAILFGMHYTAFQYSLELNLNLSGANAPGWITAFLSTTVTGLVKAGASGPFNDGAVHTAIMTYDGANLRVYVDGTQIATAAGTGNIVASGGDRNTLGGGCNADNTAPVYPFIGNLPLAAAWNRALSSAEVAQAHAYLAAA